MFSEIDTEERDALQVIDSSALREASTDVRIWGVVVIRIGAAGAGVQQFKECRFPGRAVIVARAAKSGRRERGEGAAIKRSEKEGMGWYGEARATGEVRVQYG